MTLTIILAMEGNSCRHNPLSWITFNVDWHIVHVIINCSNISLETITEITTACSLNVKPKKLFTGADTDHVRVVITHHQIV